MIPFPGESAPLDWANVTAGAPFADDGDAIRFRAGSATLTAGDAFVAGFFDHRYLEAGADAVFSFVVETLAGSSGTLSISGGPDAAWALGDAAASAYDLGDHAVTGAQTLVVSLPWLTVADYLAEAVETAVRVECTAGSVVVQQVKLRIWPPAGVGGGWSAPYTQPPQVSNASILDTGGSDTGPYDTQAAMRAAAAALVTGPTAAASTYVTTGQIITASDPAPPQNSTTFGAAYISRPPGNLTGPGFEEDSWIVPPTEVRGDDDRVIFQPTGDDDFTWVQGTATLAAETVGLPTDGLFHLDATPVAEREPTGTLFESFVVGSPWFTYALTGSGIAYTNATVPEFDTPYLRVTIWHDGAFGPVADDTGGQVRLANGTTLDEVTFDRLTYRWTPAPYRYWSPTAIPAPPVTKLRQYNRDDGLGVAPRRAYGGASRNNTGRAYGYT